MRVPLALAASSVALLAVACAEMEARSAFSGPWVEREGETLVVAYSPGGGVFATARELGDRMRAGETFKFTGDCLSACALALMNVVSDAVCWTDRARFLFHAAHVNGKRHMAQTVANFNALPAGIRALLPDPAEWRVDRWHVISGRDAHAALGRGFCKEIG